MWFSTVSEQGQGARGGEGGVGWGGGVGCQQGGLGVVDWG